jgi:flagellar biosynthesis/type III secretory pathway M-ring protein FliF/YscJ
MSFSDDVKEAFQDGDTSAWEFWVVIAAGVVLVLLLVCLFACCTIRRRRRKAEQLREELNKQDPNNYWDDAAPSPHAVVNMRVRSLLYLLCHQSSRFQ